MPRAFCFSASPNVRLLPLGGGGEIILYIFLRAVCASAQRNGQRKSLVGQSSGPVVVARARPVDVSVMVQSLQSARTRKNLLYLLLIAGFHFEVYIKLYPILYAPICRGHLWSGAWHPHGENYLSRGYFGILSLCLFIG